MRITLPEPRQDKRGESIIRKRIDDLIDAIARYGGDSPMWGSTLQLLVEVRPEGPRRRK